MKETEQKRRIAAADALNSLLEKKSLDDISVAQICKLAGISRSSFYRCFYGIQEIPCWL